MRFAMPHYEEKFQSHDGLPLHENRWLPEGESAATVLFVHGFTEHSGRYAELAETLNRHGYAVYAMDLPGHGWSDGEPVLIRSFDQYLADLELFFESVRRREPGKPLFLFGHSMGAAIVVLFSLGREGDLAGLVVSAGALRIGGRVFPILRHLAMVTSRLAPRLRIVTFGGKMLSRDPDVVADFDNDPLVFHGRFPVCSGAEILRAARRIQREMDAVRTPLLILHGTGDRVTDPAGSRLLYARAGSTDKTLKLYDGLYHDLFHEPEKDQVTADVIEWLDARRRDGEAVS